MPCNSDYPTETDIYQSKIVACYNSLASPALCMFLSKYGVPSEKEMPKLYANAGITEKQLARWWKHHKKEDADRRKRIASTRRKEKLRKSALAKLSASERKALGVSK